MTPMSLFLNLAPSRTILAVDLRLYSSVSFLILLMKKLPVYRIRLKLYIHGESVHPSSLVYTSF
jgi:hypothetical protein